MHPFEPIPDSGEDIDKVIYAPKHCVHTERAKLEGYELEDVSSGKVNRVLLGP